MRWRSWGIALKIAALILTSQPVSAQIRRTEYLKYLPSPPQVIGRTIESDRLHLYGDRQAPAYRDSDPADGIDDARAERLLELAEHFSPILRRNNFSVPRDFRTTGAQPLFLKADRWVDGHLSESDSTALLAPTDDGRAGAAPSEVSAPNDARWVALLQSFDPRRTDPRQRAPGPVHERVLFFDFPGYNEATWRAAYSSFDRRESRIYAHPFFVKDDGDGDGLVTLVMQYWFFYPFNDGANNHEGDWEHVNVAITTRARAAPGGDSLSRGLSSSDVARILDSSNPLSVDSLSIRWVAYYFHQLVMTLDYGTASTLPRCPQACDSSRAASRIWEDPGYVAREVAHRKTFAEGRFATHPFVFVGGHNRGPDELLHAMPRFNKSYNNNSHASYPFPAMWRTVGAFDATERAYGELAPSIRESSDSVLPWWKLLADNRYVTYNRSRIILLPDWEEVLPLFDASPEARAEWGWMILPIHFGYPASRSPGGGAMARVNMGNVSPFGPTFNAGWNRPRVTPDHALYDPHILRVWYVPTSPFTALRDGWGFLNWPIAAFGLLPGVQVVFAQLSPWMSAARGLTGGSPARTFIPKRLPEHLTSVVVEPMYDFGGYGFARMLPGADDPAVERRLEHGRVDDASYHRSPTVGARVRMLLHYTDRLAFENAYARDTSHLSYDIVDSGGAPLGVVRGRMVMQQLSAGLRMSRPGLLPRSTLMLRGGYMWTWIKVPDARLDDLPLTTLPRKSGHVLTLKPSTAWWPNSMYAGVGTDWYAPSRARLFGVLSWGLSAEVNAIFYPLRAHACDCILKYGDLSLGLVFGW